MTELSVQVTDLHIEFEVFSDRRAGLRQRLATKEGSGRRVIEAVNSGFPKCQMLPNKVSLCEDCSSSIGRLNAKSRRFQISATYAREETDLSNEKRP